METYIFETDQFGISNEGIHLLRSKFNYETILFSEVNEIIIKKGRQVNNWILILIFGILLFFGGIIYGIKLLDEYFWGNIIHVFYIEQFLLPLFPILLGSLAIYSSLKIGLVLKIKYGSKIKYFPIEKIRKKPGIEELKNFFNSNFLTRMCFKNSN